MQHIIGSRLKTRLYLMVLVAFLPIAGLIFYINEKQKTHETKAILQKTMLLAKAAANEEVLHLESTHNLLMTLSHAFLKFDNHPNQFSGLLADLLKDSKGYKEFGVLATDGRLLAKSSPLLTADNYRNQDWSAALRNSRKMSVGFYKETPINGAPVLYFTAPVLDRQKNKKAIVFAAVDLNRMNRTIIEQLTELPKGSRLTLLDYPQGGIRYDANIGRWSVPKNFALNLRRQIGMGQTGTLSAMDNNGVFKIYGFAPLKSAFSDRQVSLVLEIPWDLALKDITGMFFRNLVLLVLSALIAVAFIWRAGDYIILNPLNVMVRASRQLASGNLDVRIGDIDAADELSHLAKVFDEMAASLKMRVEGEKQISATLKESREQFRNLVAYQHEAIEQERIRIAREIHDQFGQSLTILKMDLSWINKHLSNPPFEVEQKIGTMAELIDDTMKNIHSVTAELRPVILEDFGLAAALEWQVEKFRKRTGITCRFENNGYEPELNNAQATAIFRTFQEALTNILRHASADQVVVYLKKEGIGEEEVILQVEDNGRGITRDEIENPQSYGLLGMRERLYPLNGHVFFKGQKGQGTCVIVRLPIDPK
ncbi:MAG: histidine kinase [Desulfobacteraceae bacterium]|jgi:signal transduction histidine kinase